MFDFCDQSKFYKQEGFAHFYRSTMFNKLRIKCYLFNVFFQKTKKRVFFSANNSREILQFPTVGAVSADIK